MLSAAISTHLIVSQKINGGGWFCMYEFGGFREPVILKDLILQFR